MTIRKATSSDISAIYQLVVELAVYENEPEAVTATIQDYITDFEAGIFECLVAESDNIVVGIAIYYMSYSTWKGRMMYLEDFVVKEAFRKSGIGQLLFDRFLEEARKQGCRLARWQVLDWNEPALKFYEKNMATIEKNWWLGKLFLSESE